MPHDVHATDRRRELHAQAAAAGVANPASLALTLAAAEAEGWRVTLVSAEGDEAAVKLRKVARTLPRDEIAERIRVERAQGWSLRAIARDLERDGVQAPRGASWAPSTVARVSRG